VDQAGLHRHNPSLSTSHDVRVAAENTIIRVRTLVNTPTQLLEAEAWLRERIKTGAVDGATGSLIRWNDETQQIESVLGERVDLLAGKDRAGVRRSRTVGTNERRKRLYAGTVVESGLEQRCVVSPTEYSASFREQRQSDGERVDA
jgi:hypothetical protein